MKTAFEQRVEEMSRRLLRDTNRLDKVEALLKRRGVNGRESLPCYRGADGWFSPRTNDTYPTFRQAVDAWIGERD